MAKKHYEKRDTGKLKSAKLHFEECPNCHFRGELCAKGCKLILCSYCVCKLVPHPYMHNDEWKAILFAERRWEGRKRVR
jgi:hypothetical protein